MHHLGRVCPNENGSFRCKKNLCELPVLELTERTQNQPIDATSPPVSYRAPWPNCAPLEQNKFHMHRTGIRTSKARKKRFECFAVTLKVNSIRHVLTYFVWQAPKCKIFVSFVRRVYLPMKVVAVEVSLASIDGSRSVETLKHWLLKINPYFLIPLL